MTDADSDQTPPRDPKEAMRAALEAKKAAQKGGHGHAAAGGKAKGAPQAQAATKREFRRKSG